MDSGRLSFMSFGSQDNTGDGELAVHGFPAMPVATGSARKPSISPPASRLVSRPETNKFGFSANRAKLACNRSSPTMLRSAPNPRPIESSTAVSPTSRFPGRERTRAWRVWQTARRARLVGCGSRSTKSRANPEASGFTSRALSNPAPFGCVPLGLSVALELLLTPGS